MPSNLGDLIAFLIGRTALVLLVVLPAMRALSTVIRIRRTQTDHPGRSSRYVASTRQAKARALAVAGAAAMHG